MTDWTALEQAAQAATDMPDDLSPTERREWKPRMTVDPSTILALLAELREAQKRVFWFEQAGGVTMATRVHHEFARAEQAEAEAARLREQVQALQANHDNKERLLGEIENALGLDEYDYPVSAIRKLQGELAEARALMTSDTGRLDVMWQRLVAERDAAREALIKVIGHTGYMPGSPYTLLAGLLQSCARIARAALGQPTEPQP